MRLLLDEQFPIDYVLAFEVPTVHVHNLGWTGIKNGELLRRAAGVCDAFVTLDRSLPFQQNTKVLSFGIIVVRAASNRLADLLPLAESIAGAARRVVSGEVLLVGV